MLQMSSSSDYERHKNNNNNSSSSSSGRSSRNKKKGAPFMFFTNILKKKKVLSIDEIKEMKTRTRSEPSGKGASSWIRFPLSSLRCNWNVFSWQLSYFRWFLCVSTATGLWNLFGLIDFCVVLYNGGGEISDWFYPKEVCEICRNMILLGNEQERHKACKTLVYNVIFFKKN